VNGPKKIAFIAFCTTLKTLLGIVMALDAKRRR
jgi:hypothetical protein